MFLIDVATPRDPALNLALEEYVLRELNPEHTYLLLFVNPPSVIIGRNQNSYAEVNHRFIRNHNIPVYRRISGGGAVYHDEGNLNFSFITDYDSRRLNNYEDFNRPIIDALKALGIPAYMDDRNAIRVHSYKISGNAQFSATGRMFSHGTLLFDTDLEVLNRALRPDLNVTESRGQKSVRSKTVNIRSLIDSSMTMETFKNRLLEVIQKDHFPDLSRFELQSEAWDKIREFKRRRYDTWDWNIGKSPRFSVEKRLHFEDGFVDINLEIDKGHISWASLDSDFVSGALLHALEKHLLNARFENKALHQSLSSLSPTVKNGFLTQFVDRLVS